jgi:hypothetical protein
MTREGTRLIGHLPDQPNAGKLEYQIYLHSGPTPPAVPEGSDASGVAEIRSEMSALVPAGSMPVPESGPVVIRYRGDVPLMILLPHIFLMFLGMLFANRAGLEALRRVPVLFRYSLWTLVSLVVGGLVLGPLVQWFSFGQFWTGVPFGWDLTDNKTLIAVVAWLAVVLVGRRGRSDRGARGLRGWVLAAAVITLVVFSIPHSLFGTKLDVARTTTTGTR